MFILSEGKFHLATESFIKTVSANNQSDLILFIYTPNDGYLILSIELDASSPF